jgi:serine/threonine protein kinase
LHRDIKPANFLMGNPRDKDNKNEVYLVDYGLAKKWCGKNGDHIVERKGRSMTGTIRFCSVNMHQGIEQARRDDLEAIGYMAVYMVKGSIFLKIRYFLIYYREFALVRPEGKKCKRKV